MSPRGCSIPQDPLECELGRAAPVVTVGYGDQHAPVAHRKDRRILVGLRVPISFRGTAQGEGDGHSTLPGCANGTQIVVVASAQKGGSHVRLEQPSTRGSGFVAKAR